MVRTVHMNIVDKQDFEISDSKVSLGRKLKIQIFEHMKKNHFWDPIIDFWDPTSVCGS